jgi:hypothetical protein
MVTTYAPGTVDVVVVRLNVADPPDVTEVGDNVAVTPEVTDAESVTVSGEPDVVVVRTPTEVVDPAVTDPLAEDGVSEKSLGPWTVRVKVVDALELVPVARTDNG